MTITLLSTSPKEYGGILEQKLRKIKIIEPTFSEAQSIFKWEEAYRTYIYGNTNNRKYSIK